MGVSLNAMFDLRVSFATPQTCLIDKGRYAPIAIHSWSLRIQLADLENLMESKNLFDRKT